MQIQSVKHADTVIMTNLHSYVHIHTNNHRSHQLFFIYAYMCILGLLWDMRNTYNSKLT